MRESVVSPWKAALIVVALVLLDLLIFGWWHAMMLLWAPLHFVLIPVASAWLVWVAVRRSRSIPGARWKVLAVISVVLAAATIRGFACTHPPDLIEADLLFCPGNGAPKPERCKLDTEPRREEHAQQ